MVRRRGLKHADARELVQEVLIAVAGAIGRWDPNEARGSFRGWLSTIARNLTINVLRREDRHVRGTGDSGFKNGSADYEQAEFERDLARLELNRA